MSCVVSCVACCVLLSHGHKPMLSFKGTLTLCKCCLLGPWVEHGEHGPGRWHPEKQKNSRGIWEWGVAFKPLCLPKLCSVNLCGSVGGRQLPSLLRGEHTSSSAGLRSCGASNFRLSLSCVCFIIRSPGTLGQYWSARRSPVTVLLRSRPRPCLVDFDMTQMPRYRFGPQTITEQTRQMEVCSKKNPSTLPFGSVLGFFFSSTLPFGGFARFLFVVNPYYVWTW